MTIKKFNRTQFDCRQMLPQGDPDLDLLSSAVKLAVPSIRQREYYIPAIPLRFLREAATAGDALPVLLVALAMMRMKDLNEIALGPALWSMIDNPGPRVRARLLKQIAALPEELCTLEPRRGRPHLLRTGPDWPKKMTRRKQE
ncbi:hypothetical protein [Acidithiobacillus concretivorus]|uniref:Uncharacterized protein n=1 Tax=Acidithiobacillus concretivorus TaxID=3063952 RepID=A0ABS5ZM17_9PROT|nr:hypothetical protein [Acidithiobacillus concretivorus]MBU2737694.1 hypothetical protein [Acidithiobacillus concretivorus]